MWFMLYQPGFFIEDWFPCLVPELSSRDWNVPQSRSRIYLLIVRAHVATSGDLENFKDIFLRSVPAKTQAPSFTSVSKVRDYVAGVLKALDLKPTLPPKSEDLLRAFLHVWFQTPPSVYSKYPGWVSQGERGKKWTLERSRTIQNGF